MDLTSVTPSPAGLKALSHPVRLQMLGLLPLPNEIHDPTNNQYNASNSAYDNKTAFGVLCLVIATAPPSAACSKIAPNSFLKRVAATVGTSTSSPSRLRNVSVGMRPF